MSFSLWTAIYGKPEEESSEASGTVVQDIPVSTENKQATSDSITATTSGEPSAVEAFPPCPEEGTSDHDSSTETAISTSTDDGSIDAEIDFVLRPTASNYAGLQGRSFGGSPNSGGEMRRRFRSSADEDLLNATEQNVEFINKFMKPFLFDVITGFIGLLTSILAIAFGAGNVGKCPADSTLPYIVLIIGLLGFLIISYVLWRNSEGNDSLSENERAVISRFCWVIFILCAWETGQFSSLEFSMDATADDYCSHGFYTFTTVMNIFAALGFFLAVCFLGADSNPRASSPSLGDNGYIPFDDF